MAGAVVRILPSIFKYAKLLDWPEAEMDFTLCHTCASGVLLLTLLRNSIQEILLASFTTRRALLRRRRKDAKLVAVGYVLKIRSAFLRSFIALAHSSFHHGTRGRLPVPRERGTLALAACTMAEVKTSMFCDASRLFP
jgi:hypothetical protein